MNASPEMILGIREEEPAVRSFSPFFRLEGIKKKKKSIFQVLYNKCLKVILGMSGRFPVSSLALWEEFDVSAMCAMSADRLIGYHGNERQSRNDSGNPRGGTSS